MFCWFYLIEKINLQIIIYIIVLAEKKTNNKSNNNTCYFYNSVNDICKRFFLQMHEINHNIFVY